MEKNAYSSGGDGETGGAVPSFMQFLDGCKRYHIAILVGLTFLTRAPVLLHLDDAVIAWRPADNASIALNFLHNGFHLFHPQIDWGGGGPGYVEMEFPIVQFVTALLYALFGAHESIGLVVPLLSALGTVIVMYLLVESVSGAAVALATGCFVAISPSLLSYSELFYIDPSMVFLTVLGIYCWTRWLRFPSWKDFALSALSLSLATLIKPTALHAGLVIAYLSYSETGFRFLRDPKHWVYAGLVIIPPVLWYVHAHTLFTQYHNTFGILSGGMVKTASAELLLSPQFYLHTLLKLALYQITPCVFLCMLVGLFVRQKTPFRHLFQVWAGSVAVYAIIAARGVDSGNQYLLPAIAPGAALGSIGLFALLGKLADRHRFRNKVTGLVVAGGLAGILTVNAVGAERFYRSRDFWGPYNPYQQGEKRSGLMVGRVTATGEHIIVVNSLMDGRKPEESMTPADLFYFSGRHGWYLSFSWVTPERIERLRSLGADYLTVSSNYASDFKTSCGPAFRYLSARYRVIIDDGEGLVIDLRGEKSRNAGISFR